MFKICKDDNLVQLLRETFSANPLRVPEERIQPLAVIAKKKNSTVFLGNVNNLLSDKVEYSGEFLTSEMANVSASNTKSIDFSLGFEILNGFLQGMGIDGGNIKADLRGIEKVSFSFQGVVRKWVDIGMLGNFFKGKTLDKSNSANNLFYNEKYCYLIIDSTIQSDNFSMNVEKTSTQDFKLNVPSIAKTIGEISQSIEVKSAGNLSISFVGQKKLAFAFSAISAMTDKGGMIQFAPSDFRIQSSVDTGREIDIVYTPNRAMVSREDELLDLEYWHPAATSMLA